MKTEGGKFLSILSPHKTWWVGGAVRDSLLGIEPEEYDVATTAHPDEVERKFRAGGFRAHPAGRAFGVVRVELDDRWYEVATLRKETGYSDHRHPDEMTYTEDPREDAGRRDFTVNAMFIDMETGEVLDFFNGRTDLRNRILRAVGAPAKRFEEDHLRKLRMARFSAQLGFDVEPQTLHAVKADPRIEVSAERTGQEFTRLLTSSDPERGLRQLAETGLLGQFIPEVAAMQGVRQPPRFHPEGDVWTHTLLMFNKAEKPIGDIVLALAILLHDVGKPFCIEESGGRIRFPRHAAVGARIASEITGRLRYPAGVTAKVHDLIRSHMRIKDTPQMRESKLKRFLADPLFPLHLELHRLDCLSSHGKMGVYDFLKARHDEWLLRPEMPRPLVNGHDLLQMGIAPGPEIGQILRDIYDAQLEGKVKNREEGLETARRLMQ